VKGRVCCRLRWFTMAKTVAGLGGVAVFFLLPRIEVPIPASSPPLFLSVFLLLVLSSLSLFFSSILSFYSSVLFSLFFFLSFLLCFFSFSLCFLLFSIFLFFLSIPCIYRQKKGGERPIIPVQSWHKGRVVGAVQPFQNRLRGTSPLFFTPW